ncbi:hypothetical protein F4779DRAFT_436856 [Xylariaceae sp. FL0662B]|nr:hypothetical protein F4779DRAFT_436856 [Xylariaceae sp. FL0662B]
MSKEVKNPKRNTPRAMVVSVNLIAIMVFTYLVMMLYYVGDLIDASTREPPELKASLAILYVCAAKYFARCRTSHVPRGRSGHLIYRYRVAPSDLLDHLQQNREPGSVLGVRGRGYNLLMVTLLVA